LISPQISPQVSPPSFSTQFSATPKENQNASHLILDDLEEIEITNHQQQQSPFFREQSHPAKQFQLLKKPLYSPYAVLSSNSSTSTTTNIFPIVTNSVDRTLPTSPSTPINQPNILRPNPCSKANNNNNTNNNNNRNSIDINNNPGAVAIPTSADRSSHFFELFDDVFEL
jgi:hypothetical protein